MHRWKRLAVVWLGVLLAPALANAAEAWKPQRHVELIVPTGAGGSMDLVTRTVEHFAREMKLVPVSTAVVNRAGGEHAVAYNYIQQKAGDPHFLALSSPVLITNHISGVLPMTYTDVTPIAALVSEYYLIVVKADSPIKTAKDLVETLRQKPDAVSLAGGNLPQRMALGAVLQLANADMKRAKIVTISGAKTSLTVAGGHVDVGVAAPGQALPLMQGGQLRAIAVTAPKRLGGALATVPTWTELGYKDAAIETWRAVIAPKGLTPAQIAYWETVLRRVTESAEFHAVAQKNEWDVEFRNAEETRKMMEADYARLKRVMSYMGITK